MGLSRASRWTGLAEHVEGWVVSEGTGIRFPVKSTCRSPAAGTGVLGMATRPDRHHASRRSSSVQAMAYTMAVNRHITPKPGQGWRV